MGARAGRGGSRPALLGAASLALAAIAGLAVSVRPMPASSHAIVVIWIAAILLAALAAAGRLYLRGRNLHQYYGEPDPSWRCGGEHALVATQLASDLASRDAAATVYSLGPPRMWCSGVQTLPCIARRARGIDVEQTFVPRPQLAATGWTAFVALPERRGELDLPRAWFPGGQTRDVYSPSGKLLFSLYEIAPLGDRATG